MSKAITSDSKPLARELIRKALSGPGPLNRNIASPGNHQANMDDTRQISAMATGQINAATSGKGINVDAFA
ncbi:MAG: hypothetical protein HZA01_03965 [Nitrospinae bacterium]|nr:hypothetical protein [Nitrospinota bacterium]